MNWWTKIKEYIQVRPYLRITIGGLCIVYGVLALFTPFTPGSWLVFIGLELIGVRLLLIDRVKQLIKKPH